MSESQTEVAISGSGPGEPEGKTAFKTSNNRNLTDRLFTVLVTAAAFFGIVVLAVLLIDVLRDGLPFVDLQFLTSLSSITPANAGVYGALVGSIFLIVLTALITVPIGVGAAIYLEEYAGDNFLNRLVEVTISNLAAVPSIIYGILGLGLFVNGLFGSGGLGPILLAGALTLSLLVLPVIIIATREALRAVPGAVREGGIALGATKWEVTRDHVLPSALPGALTGIILALSRALGETAPLIVVGAVTFATFAPPLSPEALAGRYGALPIQIYDYIQRFRPEFKDELAPAGIVVMMAVLLLVNSVAIVLRNRWQQRH